ncbi:uncharacterized protein Tco025E_07063 [Trypanosoma conorhini]|uniref:Uncharacterized protein n=1 Tax=Trypanosoma conorhini TaxID=83891 RepID=A0A3R7NWU0_9TRYP|nr:uncharacterized protein Tco025E_07063 [Trypanosoma conorhini]RNF08940.1 uncharacterized protein Tco025E_07063 [Trypanosoma conorhini]
MGKTASSRYPFPLQLRWVRIVIVTSGFVLLLFTVVSSLPRPRDPLLGKAFAATDDVPLQLHDTISSVESLAEVLARLPRAREVFERLYTVRNDSARLSIMPEFRARAEKMFSAYAGSREELLRAIENQQVVEVRNVVTGETALFNSIRRFRPGGGGGNGGDAKERMSVSKLYTEGSGADLCDFCDKQRTAHDIFGRITGKHAYTAANVAKLSKWHGLIITNVHNPLLFDADVIADIIAVSHRWFKRAHREDLLYVYPNLICDVGKRASASQIHFHVQMALTRGHYFAGIDQLQRAAVQYSERHGTSYWDELVLVHQMLGLAVRVGNSTVLSSVCPRKERELFVLSKDPEDPSFARAVALALMTLRDAAGVHSFSFAISYPPLDTSNNYSLGKIPAIFRVIDRGSALDPRSDTGALEYFGSTYIAADPYAIIPHLTAAVYRSNASMKSNRTA